MTKEDIQLHLRTEHCILMQLLDHILPFPARSIHEFSFNIQENT